MRDREQWRKWESTSQCRTLYIQDCAARTHEKARNNVRRQHDKQKGKNKARRRNTE